MIGTQQIAISNWQLARAVSRRVFGIRYSAIADRQFAAAKPPKTKAPNTKYSTLNRLSQLPIANC
jgi:hypothetical protein